MKTTIKSEKYWSAAAIIKRMELFDGSEEFKKPLTKKQFLAQRIGFTINFPLEDVIELFQLKPNELTLNDIMHYILEEKINEVIDPMIHRPWDEEYMGDNEEIKEGDLIVMNYM